MDLQLDGKTALVAAASSGLGYAVAHALAEEGAAVSIAARGEERLNRAVSELREVSTSGEVSGHALDVRDEEAVRSWVEEVAAERGGVDIVVTNAGGPPKGPATAHELATFREALELNLLSAVSLVSTSLPHMRRNGWGRVLFMTSLSVKQPVDGLALSNTVRPGLLGYAKSLVQELGGSAITVNTLAPGMTRTSELEKWASSLPGGVEELTEGIPLGRLGEPGELGSTAAFLASPRAGYITGAVLPVDGGAVQGLS
ncbi:SDR family NAD(P)-dependent oxidoreductase [Actinopolyspora mortivallis]|uniref:SDR family NAD(P)-dependent oxidoreductase n=1 Tax=Actinopolyspora mortivallis TaxID=33906 RepID=UPI00036F91FE|nr:SDR family oxidoreductase [Actinopolyspora mortivallis]